MNKIKKTFIISIIFIELYCIFIYVYNKTFIDLKFKELSFNLRVIIIVSLVILSILVILFAIYYIKNKKFIDDHAFPTVTNQFIVKDEKKQSEISQRFYKLNKIDEEMANYNPVFDDDCNLEEFCRLFRDYSADKLKLYFDIEDIRKFVASLGVSKIIILQGMSGTGKTSLAYAFGEFINNSSTIVPIQPMWKERTDLIGYYNEFTHKFNETLILQQLYYANYKDDMFITVLDEMNIARVEYYFAEFLSLLELPNSESRYLEVINDHIKDDPILLKDGKIKLPDNMWFIGTINNDDSTFAISDKVYDRSMILNLDRRALPFRANPTKEKKISFKYFSYLIEDAKKEFRLTARNKKRIRALDKYLIENFNITFGNRIYKQLNEYIPIYLACGGREHIAIDDFIAKKILPKLERLNQVYVRNNSDQLVKFIDELFGKGVMTSCIKYINKLKISA